MTPNIEVLATVEDKVDPGHSAVLVIDVQNDFCDDEGYLHRLGLDINASQA
ncbi:MAG: isochorismatase, partial [Deltaproteobacteria bacterium]|nr:isochorismatase [Deltaproteobacteria bacterium]